MRIKEQEKCLTLQEHDDDDDDDFFWLLSFLRMNKTGILRLSYCSPLPISTLHQLTTFFFETVCESNANGGRQSAVVPSNYLIISNNNTADIRTYEAEQTLESLTFLPWLLGNYATFVRLIFL